MRAKKTSSAFVLLSAVMLLAGGCKKSEPPPKPAPVSPAVVREAPKPAEPKKAVLKKPAKKKPPPAKVSREAAAEDTNTVKDLLDISSPEITGSKLPAIVYFYAVWDPMARMTMGLVEGVAGKYKGKVRFFMVNYEAARDKKVLPKEVYALPYLMFIKDGKRFGKPGFAGDAKEVTFAIEDWLAGDEDEDEVDDAEEL